MGRRGSRTVDKVKGQQLPPKAVGRVKRSGLKATERLEQILNDDTAFGPNGWLSPKEQVQAIEAAMNRAYGKPENIKVELNQTSISLDTFDSLQEIYDRLPLPERKLSQKATEPRMVHAEVNDAEIVSGTKKCEK